MMEPKDDGEYYAILFPADGRPPHIVRLKTSITGPNYYQYAQYSPQVSRVPHPELFMDYIADNLGTPAWQCLRVDALDCMTTKLVQPYCIFYPVVSRDGMPFPVNKCVREIQKGKGFSQENFWRGDLVVAKFRDCTFTSMVDAKMADFPIVKNYFLTQGSPVKVGGPSGEVPADIEGPAFLQGYVKGSVPTEALGWLWHPHAVNLTPAATFVGFSQ